MIEQGSGRGKRERGMASSPCPIGGCPMAATDESRRSPLARRSFSEGAERRYFGRRLKTAAPWAGLGSATDKL